MALRISNVRFRITGACLLALAVLSVLTGCQQPMRTPYSALATGEFDDARLTVRENLSDDREDRRYLLDRMRLGVLTLADGYPRSAQTVFEEVYDVLRTQGINRDRTVASVVLNEDIKIWKGEPFEQALAMAYYGMVQAELNAWDNTRAAADNSLFYLRDFGENEQGQRLDTHAIARRSLLYERSIAAGKTPEQALQTAKGQADYLDHGYVVRKSNFTLGYLLHGIASQQLGRGEEASDHFTRVTAIDPGLEDLTEAFRAGRYNTVLVVSWGLGPEKQGYGPDEALARFVPRFASDRAELFVKVGDFAGRRYPQVLDVNKMAGDHMWNNLADVRQAKSTLGSVLLYGGATAAVIGHNHDSREAMYAGLGAAAAGLFLKAGAHVDTRYADVYPQRFYVVPLYLEDPEQPIMLQVDGEPGSRLVLRGLGAPEGQPGGHQAQLRYVRLVSGHAGSAPTWARAGEIHYGNPRTGPVAGTPLPYILGGHDGRPPTERVLDSYQRMGYLRDMTLSDLRELYRLEGIRWTIEDQRGYAGRHVLEGGRSLVAPLAGTTGFARIFGQLHSPYRPKSDGVIDVAEQVRTQPPRDVIGRRVE